MGCGILVMGDVIGRPMVAVTSWAVNDAVGIVVVVSVEYMVMAVAVSDKARQRWWL